MAQTATQDISDLVVSVESVPQDGPDKTLGSVLSKVSSSHLAVFIFDDEGEFQGLVSPFKTLYSGNYPPTTSVRSILFTPPTLTADTPLYEAVTHMLATKIYSLPVFDDDGKVIGVIHGEDILEHVIDSPALLRAVSDAVEVQDPVTTSINATVGDVHALLKEQGISRIVLTAETGAVAGIVTRGDLMHAFTSPSVGRRFPSEGSDPGSHSKGGEKTFRADYPVRKYAVTRVDTLPQGTNMSAIVSHLVSSPNRSVVLINNANRPTGFLSMRDLLTAVSDLRPDEPVPLIIGRPDPAVSSSEIEAVERYLNVFGVKLKKRMAVERINLTSEGIKSATGQTESFAITLMVTAVAGDPLIANVESRGFLEGVQSATSLIEKQRRRSGLSQNQTRHSRR